MREMRLMPVIIHCDVCSSNFRFHESTAEMAIQQYNLGGKVSLKDAIRLLYYLKSLFGTIHILNGKHASDQH